MNDITKFKKSRLNIPWSLKEKQNKKRTNKTEHATQLISFF